MQMFYVAVNFVAYENEAMQVCRRDFVILTTDNEKAIELGKERVSTYFNPIEIIQIGVVPAFSNVVQI